MTRRGLSLLVVTALGAAPSLAQAPLNRDYSDITHVPDQPYPFWIAPKTAPAAPGEIDLVLREGDLVMGVVVGEEARAYPIGFFWGPAHEVLNDTVGGTPIAATWCPLAHTAVVFAREVGGRALDLSARGVDRGALLLHDRPTGSTWSQIAGQALSGPLAEARLEEVPSVVTTWGQWRALHPETSVYLDPEHPYKRWYTAASFARMNAAAPGPPRSEDWVVGVRGARTTRAWLVRRLAASRVANDVVDGEPIVVFLLQDLTTLRVLRRDVGGRTLTFAPHHDRLRDRETGTLWDPFTGKAVEGPLAGRALRPVPFTTALWYAWSARHPESQVAP